MERRILLYIAMSLDGYIAKPNDDIDFLAMVEVPGEDYGYAEFTQNIDTMIWGRRTYDKILTFGGDFVYKDKKIYVLSNSRTGSDDHVTYFSDIESLVKKLRSESGKDIYCDGGGDLVHLLLERRLIDQVVVSVIPHLLGDGIRLFKGGSPEQQLCFKRSVSYPSGLVQLWYDVRRE